MGKKTILLEDTVGEFIVTDRATSIQESATNGRSFLKIAGRLSLCDTLNGNNRIYPRNVWERQFSKGSRLMELIERNRSVGLLEHPKDGQVSLLSPISHLLVDAKLQENGEVRGELLIINTAEGQKLRALIEAGYNPLVSSRGYGSLEKNTQGQDIVQDDYVCEGWDVVFHPSFKQCELEAVAATESSNPKPTAALRESTQDLPNTAVESPKISAQVEQPKAAPVGAASSAPKLNENTTMDAIRNKLNQIAALEPKKMAPAQLTESRAQLRGLHNEAAKWLAEDATRSYEASQLHKAIEEVESRWDEAITQPRVESTRLLTERQKALSVLGATVETAKAFKKQLSEAVTTNGKLSAVNAKLLEAVRAWKAEAEKWQAQSRLNEDKYNLACQSLDIMADRWKSNTTELGRKIVELECEEALKTNEEARTKLAEAAHPDDVADIREALLPKKPATPVNEGKEAAAQPPLNEDKPKAAAEPAKTLPQPKVIRAERNPGSLKESVAIARRLSGRPLTEATPAAA